MSQKSCLRFFAFWVELGEVVKLPGDVDGELPDDDEVSDDDSADIGAAPVAWFRGSSGSDAARDTIDGKTAWTRFPMIRAFG